jgi:hypothetical protein
MMWERLQVFGATLIRAAGIYPDNMDVIRMPAMSIGSFHYRHAMS